MKMKLVATMLALTLTLSACSLGTVTEKQENETVTNVTTEKRETTEAEEHTHVYTEAITLEAGCETEGVKTYTCDCSDSYTESIAIEGHLYENYVYNEDATYLADGTETAKCNGCDLTDTRTAEGTMLKYTYENLSATKYVKKQVNVRSLPCSDGEKLGSLEMNDKITVTGQCMETNWYRIEFDGKEAYVSNNYLVDEKIVVATTPSKPVVDTIVNTGSSNAGSGNVVADSGNTNAGSSQEQSPAPAPQPVPQPEPSTEAPAPVVPETEAPTPTPEPSTEAVKNPNGYPEITSAQNVPGLAPGTYYVVDLEQIVTVNPPENMGMSSDISTNITIHP